MPVNSPMIAVIIIILTSFVKINVDQKIRIQLLYVKRYTAKVLQMAKNTCIVTCEHAGNYIPRKFVELFSEEYEIVATHAAYDIGALSMAIIIANILQAPLIYTKVTRLIVDCNRSMGSDELFSKFTKNSNSDLKKELIQRYYTKHRHTIEQAVIKAIQHHTYVVHVAVHSFTPQLNGFKRYCDIGLLYDQCCPVEQQLCKSIKETLFAPHPLRIAYNYPYRGCGDGVTVWLRKQYGDRYCGIEVEVNQDLYFQGNHLWRQLSKNIGQAIKRAMATM